MSKPIFVISCPIDTYSGYGARLRLPIPSHGVKKIRVTGSVIGYRLVIDTERYISELTRDQSDHYSNEPEHKQSG